MCGCRSPNKKVKKGNSVISNPGGSGVITRLLFQKSKTIAPSFNNPSQLTKRHPTEFCTTCIAPSRLPITTTRTATMPPQNTGHFNNELLSTESFSLPRPSHVPAIACPIPKLPTSVKAKNDGTAKLKRSTGAIFNKLPSVPTKK